MYIFELIAQVFKKKEKSDISNFDPMNANEDD